MRREAPHRRRVATFYTGNYFRWATGAGYRLRVQAAGCGLRATGYGLRATETLDCGLWRLTTNCGPRAAGCQDLTTKI